jgi:hypothetical protein
MKKGRINEVKMIIKKMVKDEKESTLSIDDEGEEFLSFSTREHGDVGEEEHSDIDYNDAYNIQKKIQKKFGEEFLVDIETVDEFVYLNIIFN